MEFDSDVELLNEIDSDLEDIEMVTRDSRSEKVYKKRFDPFTALDDNEFRNKYRLKKEVAKRVIDMVSSDLGGDERRGGRVSTELQVLACLRYWGRGEIQDDCSDMHGFSQPVLSRMAKRVAEAIASKANDFIKMPACAEEEALVMEGFRTKFNFPHVVGAIDGTHIRIQKVGGDSDQYYINRKGYYSLNTQVICDSNLKIMNIVAHWRGSTHDSRIFRESRVKEQFENNRYRGVLLGDSGYACTRYLMTPILNPRDRREEAYNRTHIRARNCVERCFGVLKQRFRCLLRGMICSLETIKVTIVALAVLHNIAIDAGDDLLPEDANTAQSLPNDNMDPIFSSNSGAEVRRQFIERYF